MKTTRRNSQQGSTMLITLITCLLIGVVLASYLGLINGRNQMAMRATAWNTAIPVLEAGIEEALAHIHDDSSPTANQWNSDSVNGQPVYWKHRTLPDGSYFCVTNFGVDSVSPVIQSAGYVPSPLKKGEFISRTVQVGMTNPPSQFNYAIAANGPVNLGGSAVVDGYDSSVGAYDVSTNRNASGGIATNSKQAKAINVSTAHLFGRAVTGYGGTVDVAGGAVGDVEWNLNHTGIEPGWIDNNMNVQFQPNTPPGGNPVELTIGNTTNFVGNGNYRVSGDVVINSATRPIVVTGKATLWVTGNFVVSGVAPNAGYVYIAPGASLMLYVGGSTTSISGGGVINSTGLPANFSYYGLPANTKVTYSGSANFVGTINAPKADFTLSANGTNPTSVYGAVICNTFTATGNSTVHYDQATSSKGILLVSSWREM
jgi:hypothetical protein